MQIAAHSPPSDYAIHAWVQGQPGAMTDVAMLTLQRSILILPGLWLTGFRGTTLAKATAAATLSITATLAVYYWWQENNNGQ